MRHKALHGGGGGHHGGHHHHGGGAFFNPMYWGGWGYPYPSTELFVVDDRDGSDEQRKLAYVMSLPANQRAAAYQKLFGKAAPAGVLAGLGDIVDTVKANALPLAAVGIAAWWLFLRKRTNPARRRRRGRR